MALKKITDFFGLTPMEEAAMSEQQDSAYYDEPHYASEGSSAYAPRTRYEREYERPEHVTPAAVQPEQDMAPYVPQVSVVEPNDFEDAVLIGNPFRDGDAVVFELTDLDRAVARRFIDFAAGLCFISYGAMHNLAKGLNTHRVIFALVPENASIRVEELQQAAGLIR